MGLRALLRPPAVDDKRGRTCDKPHPSRRQQRPMLSEQRLDLSGTVVLPSRLHEAMGIMRDRHYGYPHRRVKRSASLPDRASISSAEEK